MKRVLIFSFMAFILGVLPAFSQIRLGVKGGLNISKVHFNSGIIDSDNLTGFQIGPMMEVGVPLLGVGVETAILYTQKGLQFADGRMNDDFKSDFLEVPFNLKWKFGLPIVKGYLTTGPYVGFRLGGEKVWDAVAFQIEQKNFATGLNFGAGVEAINHLQVGLNYGLGLTNNYRGGDISGKNRTWSVTAAILF